MNLLSRTFLVLAIGLGSGCMTLPATRPALKTVQPRAVRIEFRAEVPAVVNAFSEATRTCGLAWRQHVAGMFGAAAAPSFVGNADYVDGNRSATFEIWSMNALSPDYIYELFEMREIADGVVEVIHYQGKGHENARTPRPRDVASWFPPGAPNCW